MHATLFGEGIGDRRGKGTVEIPAGRVLMGSVVSYAGVGSRSETNIMRGAGPPFVWFRTDESATVFVADRIDRQTSVQALRRFLAEEVSLIGGIAIHNVLRPSARCSIQRGSGPASFDVAFLQQIGAIRESEEETQLRQSTLLRSLNKVIRSSITRSE